MVLGVEACYPKRVGDGYKLLLESENPDAVLKDLHMHIPEHGCIASPMVEVFRESAMTGYRYYDKALPLQGVCSVAAYNKNRKMRDCPVDAPKDQALYVSGMAAKFDAIIKASLRMKGEVLIIPDCGCGVYGNDSNEVGRILGKMLKLAYGCFKLTCNHRVYTRGLHKWCSGDLRLPLG